MRSRTVHSIVGVVLASFVLSSGCTLTIREHLKKDDNLTNDYGLILPWSGKSYLGHKVRLGPGESPDKEPLEVHTDPCFYPSARSATANPGSWSTAFEYNAEAGLGGEFKYKCVDAKINVGTYQDQKLSIQNVKVFEGLGYPMFETRCVGASQPDESPKTLTHTFSVIDRVAIASSVSLNAKQEGGLELEADVSCIDEANLGGKAKLGIKKNGAFVGENLVIAARPVRVKLTRYITTLMDIEGGSTPARNTIVFGAQGGSDGKMRFKEQLIPRFLESVTISHIEFLRTACDHGCVKVRVSGLTMGKPPGGVKELCKKSNGEDNTYLIDINSTCNLYLANDQTVLALRVIKRTGHEAIEEKGLFEYSLMTLTRQVQ